MFRLIMVFLTIAFAVAAPEDVVVVRAARMFDGKGEHVVSPGLVVITGSKVWAAERRFRRALRHSTSAMSH